MSKTNEEHIATEGTLKRVRLREPSAELKAQVVRAAQDAWHDTPAGVPWQIPIRRLAVSAAAAAILFSLANLYGDCVSSRRLSGVPTASYVEPCDLDVMTDPQTSPIRFVVTAGRPARPDVSSLGEYLELFRETLRETERSDASDGPDPIERGSRLFLNLSSRHS